MTTVTEIEDAISRLPAKELAQLVAWLHEYHADAGDHQIEADLGAGRLDRLLSEVENEYLVRTSGE